MSFGDPFRAKVVTGSGLARPKSAHVQVTRHACLDAGRNRFLGQFCVRDIESTPRSTFFIEDSDEVDDHLATGYDRSKFLGIVNIRSKPLHVGQDGKMSRGLRVARR